MTDKFLTREPWGMLVLHITINNKKEKRQASGMNMATSVLDMLI